MEVTSFFVILVVIFFVERAAKYKERNRVKEITNEHPEVKKNQRQVRNKANLKIRHDMLSFPT